QVFKDNAIRVRQMEAEAEEQKTRAEAEKRAAMLKLADGFEQSVGGVVKTVASASTEMQAAAQALSATAEEASRQSTAVAAASWPARSNRSRPRPRRRPRRSPHRSARSRLPPATR